MATNADNFSFGPETPEVSQLSRFVDFRKGIFSHFVHVVFVMKYCNQLLYFAGCIFIHGYSKRPQ